MAAQRARTQAEIEVLYQAIGNAERTASDLMKMKAVRQHPLWKWRTGDPTKFRQAVYDRLNMLEDAERIVTVRRDPGPRGSKIRVVRRA